MVISAIICPVSQEKIMLQLQVAISRHNQGDLDQAEEIYKQVLSDDAENPYALRFLGCLQSSRGCHHSAISLLRQATRVSAMDPECWFSLGNAYKSDYRFEDAVASYRMAEECGSLNPHVFNNWGRCLQEMSRQQESISVLEKSVALDSSCFGAWLALGNGWRELGNVSRAIFCYKKSIIASPSFADAYLNLGSLLKDEGEYEAALDNYRKAIKLKPDFVQAYFCLANALNEQGDIEAALDNYHKAIELNPDFAQAYFCLANVLTENGDFEEALDSYRKAIEIMPDFVQAYFNLANGLKKKGVIEEALDSYQKAIELKPNYVQAYFNLANLLIDEGRVLEALENYQKVIELDPNFASAYLNLGALLKEQGKLEDAILNYRKAIAVNPDYADAYFNLGLVLKEVGELAAAAEAYAQYYRLKPIAKSLSLPSLDSKQSFGTLLQIKVPESVELIPSYVSATIPFGMHLIYVHIPKTGGIRFSNPIFECMQRMLFSGGWENYQDLIAIANIQKNFSLLVSHRIDSVSMRDGIVAALSSYDITSLDFSFLTSHGVSSRELSLAMRDHFNAQPLRIATWRDPMSRLRSALDYWYRLSEGDLELVKQKIDQKDPFLDNAIYRGCYSDFSFQLSPDELHEAQIDYLIDIGDFSVMNQIMSCFLSRCRLPNIIINKRVNVTPFKQKIDLALSDSLIMQCVDSDFLTRDSSSGILKMVSSGLPAAFVMEFDPHLTSFHPLTFIVNGTTDVTTSMHNWLLPTEYLTTDEGQVFLQKIFS
ncbi:TPR repeat-containing protein [Synechococcus sp. A18-25c]|uniref:tetratricopeptide repeat protein n=1 Tax=Synechococcus sp. A18-25c TaxID=1866938 RepID=UPI0016489C98|nr:tetratricopeptide repeat protein [Synechococcus sp. A18-25c]QNJ18464.1 TPR repeat-containing protein [Synechococcus sp. A18-25c]